MNEKSLILFFILIVISFVSSLIFSDAGNPMHWIYALVPLVSAIAILGVGEMMYVNRRV